MTTTTPAQQPTNHTNSSSTSTSTSTSSDKNKNNDNDDDGGDDDDGGGGCGDDDDDDDNDEEDNTTPQAQLLLVGRLVHFLSRTVGLHRVLAHVLQQRAQHPPRGRAGRLAPRPFRLVHAQLARHDHHVEHLLGDRVPRLFACVGVC
jgi:hypothetical protein